MLILGIWTAVLTVLIVLNEIRAAKQTERIMRLEKERDAWRLAAHWKHEA
jgi:hypothetical protein